MKSTPILFNSAMVCAILSGEKTQTRRIVKLKGNDGIQSDHSLWRYLEVDSMSGNQIESNKQGMHFWQHTEDIVRLIKEQCPYGQVGDQLWVRETFCSNDKNVAGYKADATCGAFGFDGDGNKIFVKHGYILDAESYLDNFEDGCSTYGIGAFGGKWKPSIHMPRWLSRITLKITNIRVERLNEISDDDALKEGIDRTNTSIAGYAKERFKRLWESINGAGSWSANPWVWVIEFEVLK